MSQLLAKIENSPFNIFVKRQMIEEMLINPQNPRIIDLLGSAKTTISFEDEQEITRLFYLQSQE